MTYLAIWPITDQDRPISALIAEASAALDPMARADGARLTGAPRWIVAGVRLVCVAPAARITHPDTPATARAHRDDDIVRLAGLRWSIGQIAACLRADRTTVIRAMRAAGISRAEMGDA